MGGPFGDQPLFVGLVTDFLQTGSQRPAGTGNGCWDLDFMETRGRVIVVESRSTAANGMVTGQMKQAWSVLGPRSFEGRTLLATDITVTLSTAAGVTASVQRNTSYTLRASDVGVTIHGDEGSLAAGAVSTSLRTVFTPAWTDTQYGLELGQSVLQTWAGTSTSQGVSSTLRGSRTIRFVARETVTVPAGTFETCRFEQTQASSPGPVTTWIARGWGLPVQMQSTVRGQTSTTQALRVTVDGEIVQAAASTANP